MGRLGQPLARTCARCGAEFFLVSRARAYACPVCRRKSLETKAAREPSRSLTPRERQLAVLVTKGKFDKEIAADLHLTYPTIRTYLSNLYKKLKIQSRVDLAVLVSSGLIVVEQKAETLAKE